MMSVSIINQLPPPTFEAKFNRVRLATVPRIASALVIIGIIATLLGSLGLLTALSGIKIHGLEFIAKQIPTSVALSLIMMRAGLHGINNGVCKAKALSRWRQEGMIYLMMAQLENDPNEKKRLLAIAAEYHYALPPEYRLDKVLAKEALYGKKIDDWHAVDHQYSSKWMKTWDQGWAKFYDYWASNEKTIGKIDTGVGILMGVAAITALVFLTMGPKAVPSAINILAKDPYLSLSFTFLLLAYGLDSLKRGTRMRKADKRDDRRAKLEYHFQCIINKAIPKDPKYSLISNIKEKKDIKPGIGSKLSKAAMIVGIIITFLGLIYLGLSVSNHLPVKTDILTQNTPLSVLYATTLITTGFFTYYSGASMADRATKAKWRKLSLQHRHGIFRKFQGISTVQLEKTTPPYKIENGKLVLPFRVKALDGITALGYALGIFLIVSATIGLFVVGGYKVHPALSFISADPSFSAFFCVSMALFGIDAVCNADRWRTYVKRRVEEYGHLELLERVFERTTSLPLLEDPINRSHTV